MKKRNVKSVLALFLMIFIAQVLPAQTLDKSRVTVTMENATVKQFLDEVERQTGIEFLYNADEVKNLRVTVKETNAVARQVITKVMADIGCEIKENNGIVVVRLVKEGKSRHTVSGYVVDENKEPVIGAQVRIMGTKMMTVTNADGEFYFDQTMPEKARVQITYIGMQAVHLPARNNMVVNMKSDTQMLQGVVVTGYQQLDRRNLTSSVTSKDMSELEIPGVADLSKMLEGKIPDLVSLSSSGEINATNRIRIRGTSTLIGNREPLWVLDGIILTDPVGLSPDVLNDPDYINRIGNAIAGINPQDILRIDVLKDAAATALYGTRAANGVIVVTTKSGREGKPTITYSGQFTFRKRPYYTDDKINLMNSVERIQFSQYLAEQHYIYPPNMPKVGYEQALSNLYLGIYDQQTFDEQVSKMQTMNTDWFDILCHNSFSHDHSVSVSGGSSKVRYYTSIGYTDQDDVINNTMNRRYTAMAKIDFDLTKKLKVQFNLNGYLNNRQYAQSDNNPINYAYNTSRAIPAYNSDGSYAHYLKAGNKGFYNFSILNELDNSYNKQETNAVTATANARYQATDDLFFNAVFSANISNSNLEGWWGENTFYASNLREAEMGEEPSLTSTMPYGGELSLQKNRNVGWTARLQGNYNKYLGENKHHNINVALGLEASSSNYKGDNYTQRGYYHDRGRTFASSIPLDYASYWSWVRTNVPHITDTKSNMVSAYATLSYSYKQLFTLNANGRYDGSNKFGSRSNENLLPIWSVSGNANLQEIFGIKANWLTFLRMKASYGEQGNMLDNQTPEMIIKKGNMSAYYNEMTSTAAYFANPDLKWEKTHSTNLGLEMGFFDNRLQLEAEYYFKKTTDAFMSKKISDVNGFESYIVNSGTIENRGYNVTLTATPVKFKDFYWIVSGSMSKIFNEVKTVPGAETYELNDFLSGTTVVEGQPVGTFYSYRFAGLSPVDGGPYFYDWEDRWNELKDRGNYFIYTSVLTPSGRREPDITGSFNNTITYRQWRLGFTLLYNLGAKTRLFRLFDGLNGTSYSSEQNVSRDMLDRWMKPGDEQHTNIPAILGYGNPANQYYSSHWADPSLIGWSGNPAIATNSWTMYDYSDVRVVSGDYLKLSTVNLTYELSEKQLAKLKLQRLAITLSAYNLKTWCDSKLRGQTPTQGGFSQVQLSDTPSYTLGININF